jgi:UDP:flavonoid glycosyltransferase YjiC (YdhE family)
MGSKVVLNTFGSLGDLNPYLGIALGLKSIGHRL